MGGCKINPALKIRIFSPRLNNDKTLKAIEYVNFSMEQKFCSGIIK